MKLLTVLLWPLLIHSAFAATDTPKVSSENSDLIVSQKVAKQFAALGGSEKALKHVSCILKNQRNTRFALKPIKDKSDTDLMNKCNKVEGGKAEISIHRDDYVLVIDYTRPPTSRRMFLIPVTGKGNVEAYYAGHGRFGNTPRDNTKATDKGNSITTLKLFSNKPDNNGTATGLYVAGDDYFGKYNGLKKDIVKITKKTVKDKDGKKHTIEIKRTTTVKDDPKHPAYSLVLQGVETDVNDNACARATVIHGTSKISESGKEEGVHLMSSGCPMVDYRAVNHIIEKIHGTESQGGAAILSFGPREAALDDNYYCDMRADQQKNAVEEFKTTAQAGKEKPVTAADIDAKE
jgi:hypothetical protein